MQIPDQSTNPFHTHKSNAKPLRICQSITNVLICKSVTNPPIHCKSSNPMLILTIPPICLCSANPYQMAIQYQSANPWPIHQPTANLGTNHPSTYPRPISQTMTNLWPICQSLVNQKTNAFTQKSNKCDQFTNRLTIVCQYLANPSPMHYGEVTMGRWN